MDYADIPNHNPELLKNYIQSQTRNLSSPSIKIVSMYKKQSSIDSLLYVADIQFIDFYLITARRRHRPLHPDMSITFISSCQNQISLASSPKEDKIINDIAKKYYKNDHFTKIYDFGETSPNSSELIRNLNVFGTYIRSRHIVRDHHFVKTITLENVSNFGDSFGCRRPRLSRI